MVIDDYRDKEEENLEEECQQDIREYFNSLDGNLGF